MARVEQELHDFDLHDRLLAAWTKTQPRMQIEFDSVMTCRRLARPGDQPSADGVQR
jgi:hypothetical protein